MDRGADQDGEAVVDDLFRALQAERRRHVLATLRDADGELDFAALVEAVAARETGEAPASPDGERREDVATTLHHVHLPALRDADLVAVDDEGDRTVRFAADTRTGRAHVDFCDDD